MITGLFMVVGSVLPVLSAPAKAATCANPPATYGSVSMNYSVPAAGLYRLWKRMQAASSVNDSVYLQIDGGCPITVGDGGLTTGQLVWVDWQNASTSSKIESQLTAGAHSFVITGREPGVIVDRLVMNTNTACVPQGTGDTCTGGATATPSVTPTPRATPTPGGIVTPTPTPSATGSDLNADGKVNVFDLSILLSNWGKSGKGDIDNSGVVNIFDLSKLLTSWTG